jgi:glycogen debranching enzyme
VREHLEEVLGAFASALDERGLGHVSECYDGDPPHRPRGAFAQAWSVAELLRAIHRVG